MDLRKKSHKIGFIQYGPDVKYLFKTVQVKYFAPKYLKRTFEIMSHEFGPITSGPGTKYLLNTVK